MIASTRNYFVERKPKTSTGTFKNPVREANFRNSHIAVHNKKGPTPKTQNPILGIYIATKLQDPSRLLRLAELVWKISGGKKRGGTRAETSTGTCKNLVREANFRNSHIAVHNKKKPRPKSATPDSRHLHSYKIPGPI